MKYHDSIKQAEKKMHLVAEKLRLWHLSATPINYSVSYEYITGKNKLLIEAIQRQLSSGKKLDDFFLEEIYQQLVLGQSKFRDEIITDLDEVIATITDSNTKSLGSADNFIKTIHGNIANIQSTDKKIVSNAIRQINQASKTIKLQQKKLAEQLQDCQQKTEGIQNELLDVRKQIYMDPLTNLYNRKAMSKHLETWYNEDADRNIAAIVINVDKLSQIHQEFGSLIGDVLLSKIAGKVSSYVGDSGLPIRTGGDEFLILLPDIDRTIAGEIAEKIRQGVEKLRFISSKTGTKLPPMTISLGVSDFKVSENANTMLTKIRHLIHEVQQKVFNQVTIVNTQAV